MDTMAAAVGLASIREVLQNCLVFNSIYLVDFPITQSLETTTQKGHYNKDHYINYRLKIIQSGVNISNGG